MASKAVWNNFSGLLPVFKVIEREISQNMTYSLESEVKGGRKTRRIHLGIISDRVPESKKKLLAIIIKEKEIVFQCANRSVEEVVKKHTRTSLPVEVRFEQL